jgi:hypothetical protein
MMSSVLTMATMAKLRSNVVEPDPLLNSFHWSEVGDMAANPSHSSGRGRDVDQMQWLDVGIFS